MNAVLFLTGNTPFHGLEKTAVTISKQLPNLSFTLQSISPCVESTSNLRLVSFIPEACFSEYGVIVTHAGAGTVFFLISNNIPFIAIPNLERNDSHQVELYKWLVEKKLSRTALIENLDANLILEDIKPMKSNIDLPKFDIYGLMNELFP